MCAMKTQTIYLEDYDWDIRVFYDTRGIDYPKVMDALKEIGCPKESLIRSFKNLTSGNANNGLTFSQPQMKESVISIGYASSLGEFLSTATHEIVHAIHHIAQHYGIDPYGEEIAYLAGTIAREMHPLLQQYMCSCKKK